MHRPSWRTIVPLLAVALPLALLPGSPAGEKAGLRFQVTFSDKVCNHPFSGRVFVMVSKPMIKDLPLKPKWFNPEPFFARDVVNWKPGTAMEIGPGAQGYPHPLEKLPAGTYSVQAVMDMDRGDQNAVAAPGNLYSKPIRLEIDPGRTGPIKLEIDQVYPDHKFEETERVKLVEISSKVLTAFHGKPMKLRAGIVLPESFAGERERRYPIIYEIPGFGGDHRMAHGALKRKATMVDGFEMLHVMLDPNCRLGHHVFADSANNGPYGKALVEELIPHIEKTYRALGVPGARFVTGHSSGGWSSLWLQVAYPDIFGGVWSTAPDPVDFRDFQRIDIYVPGTNVFIDDQKQPRPLSRPRGKVRLYYKGFSDMEEVLGHGGQLSSFEAVFSPRGPDGKPGRLWNRVNGKIDPAVAKSWERYDIGLILQKNWKTLGPRLEGKLHIYVGAEDSYFLEGAVVLLRKTLADLGSDAVVEIVPGRDHGNLLDTAMRTRIAREMAERFKKNKSP